jgi:hypothetical protein
VLVSIKKPDRIGKSIVLVPGWYLQNMEPVAPDILDAFSLGCVESVGALLLATFSAASAIPDVPTFAPLFGNAHSTGPPGPYVMTFGRKSQGQVGNAQKGRIGFTRCSSPPHRNCQPPSSSCETKRTASPSSTTRRQVKAVPFRLATLLPAHSFFFCNSRFQAAVSHYYRPLFKERAKHYELSKPSVAK